MSDVAVRAIRGATTVDVDTPEQIAERTLEMLGMIVESNHLSDDDLISILFTATADVISSFPATAVRTGGYRTVPLMCAQEIPVPGSLPRCIRVLVHATTPRTRDQITHVYLHEAQGLRDDLTT
jgi:chorismate mutase